MTTTPPRSPDHAAGTAGLLEQVRQSIAPLKMCRIATRACAPNTSKALELIASAFEYELSRIPPPPLSPVPDEVRGLVERIDWELADCEKWPLATRAEGLLRDLRAHLTRTLKETSDG